MVLWSTVRGCHAWLGDFDGYPGPDGDCEHLRGELAGGELAGGGLSGGKFSGENVPPKKEVPMMGCKVYFCGPLTVHESVPMRVDTLRTFARLSLPNDCPWYEGYSENPLGIKPTGPIHPRRRMQMGWRR